MLFEYVTKVLDRDTGRGLGREMGPVSFGEVKYLAFDRLKPEVGVFST
jgi:hypothetical protein